MKNKDKETKVLPNKDTTVYATDKLANAKGLGIKLGQPMTVHTAQADKLVEAGKATREKPVVDGDKPTIGDTEL